MMTEELEFQISQYADGTLPLSERAALETQLAADAEAREMLAEYRRLGEHLSRDLPPLPVVKWDRLAEHLSNVVAESDQPAVICRITPAGASSGWSWRSRLAIAASVIVAVSTGLLVYNGHNRPTPAAVVNQSIA